jgi:hypothetical protein
MSDKFILAWLISSLFVSIFLLGWWLSEFFCIHKKYTTIKIPEKGALIIQEDRDFMKGAKKWNS